MIFVSICFPLQEHLRLLLLPSHADEYPVNCLIATSVANVRHGIYCNGTSDHVTLSCLPSQRNHNFNYVWGSLYRNVCCVALPACSPCQSHTACLHSISMSRTCVEKGEFVNEIQFEVLCELHQIPFDPAHINVFLFTPEGTTICVPDCWGTNMTTSYLDCWNRTEERPRAGCTDV